MDEMDRKAESQDDRVLRAADVIPPFDKDSGDPGPPKPVGNRTAKSKKRGRKRADSAPPRTQTLEQGTAIPSFDLAESILAEQRRVTAGRRKRAVQANLGRGSAVSSRRPTYIDELSCEEQAELQEVVAQIVAKDIERLCHRSSEPACARSVAS